MAIAHREMVGEHSDHRIVQIDNFTYRVDKRTNLKISARQGSIHRVAPCELGTARCWVAIGVVSIER